MAKHKQPSCPKPPRAAKAILRKSGQRLLIRNSGLEVWLYDDASRKGMCALNEPTELPTGMPTKFEALTREGLIVGYSLWQDDDLDVEVHVGDPLGERELAKGRWLAPQTAFLRLPSGRLCVESNDSSRVGSGDATEIGGEVEVPAGDYRLTLYRIDHEALDREELTWNGPQEVIVLTLGGGPDDAAADLLSFELKRDLSWVGQYQVHGKHVNALAWFPDRFDTFVLNLDSAAVKELSLTPGSYLRTQILSPAITLISTYAASWSDARRMPPPADQPLHEFGFAALSPMGEWNGAEAMFCRRERSKARVEDQYINVWVPAIVEVLDAKALPRGEDRSLAPSNLAEKQYFDSGFLALVWSDLLPEAGKSDEFPIEQAIDALDRHMKQLKLAPLGDWECSELVEGETVESCFRLYTGQENFAGLVFAQEAICEVLFITGFGEGKWTVTGLADDFDRLLTQARERGAENSGIELEIVDDSIKTIAAAHRKAVARSKATPSSVPTSADEGAAFVERFIRDAFGPPASA